MDDGDHWSAANPVVVTQLPDRAGDGIDFVGEGYSITPVGRADAQASLLADKAFYANTDIDTDFMATTLPTGAETFFQLRSRRAPTEHALEFSSGSRLELEQPTRGGPIALLGEENPMAIAQPPAAWDANGTPVPITMRPDGNRIVLRVPHRNRHFVYPLLVDPVIVDANSHFPHAYAVDEAYPWQTQGSGDTSGWGWWTNDPHGRMAGGWYGGPINVAYANNWWGGGEQAHWYWQAPPGRTIYIERATLSFIDHQRSLGDSGSECLYEGLWSAQAGWWESGGFYEEPIPGVTSGGYGSSPVTRCENEQHRTRQHWVGWDNFPDQRPGEPQVGDPEGSSQNMVVFGLQMWGNVARSEQAHDRFGTASMILYDPDRPQVTSSLPQSSSGWIDDTGSETNVVQRSAYDPGFGPRWFSVRINPGGAGARIIDYDHGCSGDRHSPCPVNLSLSPVSFTLGEGINRLSLMAWDAMATMSDHDPGTSGSQPYTWTKKIDRTPPQLQMSGGLSRQGSADPAQANKLHVTASDGEQVAVDARRRSGVSYLEIKADGQTVGGVHSTRCPHTAQGDSCSATKSITLDPFDYARDQVRIDVTAKDDLGVTSQPNSRHITTDGWTGNFATNSNLEIERVSCGWGATSHSAREPDPCDEDNYGTKSWLDTDQIKAAVIARDKVYSGSDRGVAAIGIRLPNQEKKIAPVDCGGGCPQRAGRTFEFSAQNMPEGVHQAIARAKSPSGVVSPVRTFPLRIDRTVPAVDDNAFGNSPLFELAPSSGSGGLPAVGGPGGHAVNVNASDAGAGVRAIEILVDGERKARWSQECDNGGCGMQRTFHFRGSDYEPNRTHTIKAIAYDGAGRVDESVERQVFVADTPSRPGADRLGLEHFLAYDSTETGLSGAHVNLSTGNLVWHKVPVVNPGRGLSTFVNTTYNSFDHPVGVSGTGPIDPGVVSSMLGIGSYHQAGHGFSLGASGVTRVNEPLGLLPFARNLDETPAETLRELTDLDLPGSIVLTDPDGTRHTFRLKTGAEAEIADLAHGAPDGSLLQDIEVAYEPPPGVNLRLRLYNNPLDDLTDPGGALLEDLKRTWAITRPDGVTYFYDAWGYPTTIEDRNGNLITYEYDLVNPLTGLNCQVAPGQELAVVPGACEPRLARVVDPAGSEAPPGDFRDQRSVRFTYYSIPAREDPSRCLPPPGSEPTTWLDPVTECLGSGEAGRIQQITDHAGRRTTFAYDNAGYLTSLGERGANGSPDERITKFEYGSPAADQIPPSMQTQVAPLLPKQLESVTDPRGAGSTPEPCPAENPQCHTTRIEYEAFGDFSGLDISGVALLSHRVDGITTRSGHRRGVHYAGPGEAEPGPVDWLRDPNRDSKATVTEPWQAQGRDVRTVYELDERARPTAMTEAHGLAEARRTQLEYDTDNNPVRVIRAAGTADEQATSYDYNATGMLTGRMDALGRLTSFAYRDTAGMHRSELGFEDDADAFVSDLTALRRPRGNVWTYAYEADTASNGAPTINGNLVDETDPAGAVTHSEYDAHGQVISETEDYGTGRLNLKTTFELYDPSGFPQRVIDPNGNESGANPAQHRWLYRYDAVGNVVKAVDPRGAESIPGTIPDGHAEDAPYTTTLSYNAFDQLEREKTTKCSLCSPVETVTRNYDYDRNGNLVRRIDGENHVWVSEFTPMDRPKAETTPTGDRTEYSYDAGEHLVELTSPRGTATGVANDFATQFEIDALGRRVATIRRALAGPNRDLITSYAYDRRDNPVGIALPRNNVNATGDTVSVGSALTNAADPALGKRRFTYEYNVVDELAAEVEDPAGLNLRTEYRYDLNGNPIREISPRGFVSGADPAEHSTFTVRDALDRPVLQVDPLGNTTRNTYDRVGRMTSRELPNGTVSATAGDFTIDYTYDANGALTSRSIPWAPGEDGMSNSALDAIKVTYTRDAVGDPVQVTDGRGNSFTNSFFDSGELRSTTRPSWWELDWRAEENGNPDPALRFASRPGGAQPDFAAPVGGPTIQESPGPAAQTGPSEDLASGENSDASEDRIAPEGLEEDPAPTDFGEAQPEELPDYMPVAGQTRLSYDDEMRLEAVENASGRQRTVGYDPTGRTVTKRWPSGDRADIVHRFSWDRNDNLTKFTDELACPGPNHTSPLTNCETTFDYDEFDRRTRETAPGSRPSPGAAIQPEITEFRYDPNGNLTRRLTPRAAGTGSFDFTYDNVDRLASERNPVQSQVERWAYDYDANGNLTTETSPHDVATRTTFDAADRPAAITEALGTSLARTTTFMYDANGNQVRIAEPGAKSSPTGSIEPRVTERAFDGQDMPWKTTVAVGTSAEQTTITERDPNGNLVRVVNPKGVGPDRVPDTAYSGNPASASDAAVHATVGEYNADNLLTRVHQPHSSVAPANEPYGTKTAAEQATTEQSGQDIWGIDHAAENQRRFRQDFGYDQLGRLSKVSDTYPSSQNPDNVPSTVYDYFDSDWVSRVREPARSGTFDGVNLSLPERTLEYRYDQRGNQTLWRTNGFNDGNETDARKIKRFFYPSGMLEQRVGAKPTADPDVDADRRKYTYFYNRNRSLIETRDELPPLPPELLTLPGGLSLQTRTTTISRDAAERQDYVDEQWRSGRDTSYAYDEDGHVTERRTEVESATPKTTTFTYDSLGREGEMTVRQQTESGGTETRVTRTSYYPSGEISHRSRDSGAEEVVYWRADGRMAKLMRAPGLQPDAQSVPSGGKNTAYTYDPNGNRTTDERGTHAYSARDQLVLWKRDGDEPLPNTVVSYALNGDGAIRVQREPKVEPGAQPPYPRLSTDFFYLGDRLVRAKNEQVTSTYRYDELGNTVEIESTPHGGVLPDPGSTPVANPSCDYAGWDERNTTYYCYDEFSRMVASKGPGQHDDDPGPNNDADTYVYDGLDRRDFRISRDDAATQIREYSYVGTSQMLSREQRPANLLSGASDVATYDYDSAGRRQGQRLEPAGSTPARFRAYRTDANGSVEALESPDGGAVAGSDYHYDPYGELQDRTPTNDESDAEKDLSPDAKENPFRFQGFYYDTAVKSYDMLAREYRPDSARFLSEDRYAGVGPDIELEGDPLTQNRYSFAGANPVSRIEFDGHDPCYGSHAKPSCEGGLVRDREGNVVGTPQSEACACPAGGGGEASSGGSGSTGAGGSSPPPPPPEVSPVIPSLANSTFGGPFGLSQKGARYERRIAAVERSAGTLANRCTSSSRSRCLEGADAFRADVRQFVEVGAGGIAAGATGVELAYRQSAALASTYGRLLKTSPSAGIRSDAAGMLPRTGRLAAGLRSLGQAAPVAAWTADFGANLAAGDSFGTAARRSTVNSFSVTAGLSRGLQAGCTRGGIVGCVLGGAAGAAGGALLGEGANEVLDAVNVGPTVSVEAEPTASPSRTGIGFGISIDAGFCAGPLGCTG